MTQRIPVRTGLPGVLIGAVITLALCLGGLAAPAQAAMLSIGDPVLALGFDGDLADDAATPNPVTVRGADAATGVSYVPGVGPDDDQAVKLSGRTYLDLGTSAALQPAELSLSFWLKPDTAMAGEEVITWNKQAYNSDGWYLSSESDSVPLALSVGPGGAQPYKLRVSASDRAAFFPVGQWTHVAVTYSSASKQATFYRNGLRVPSVVANGVGGASTGVITGSESLPKTIGFNGPQYNGAYLRAALDEFLLFDGVATTEDIVTLYEQTGREIDREDVAQADLQDVTVPDVARAALSLPGAGSRGSQITWTSSDEDVIAPDGTVTPPEVGEDDVVVTLTASARFLDGEAVTRTYEVTVPAPREALSDSGLDVLLTDDYLSNATAKEHEYLLSLDSDKFLHWFYRTAGLTPPTAEGYAGWENGNVGGNFRGHAFGHYMSALSMSYASTDDPATRQQLHERIVDAVEGLAEVQDAYDGTSRAGYLGPFRDTALDAVEGRGSSDDPVIVPYYNLHKVLAGLLDVDKYVDDETGDLALEVAEGFGEYLHGRVSTLEDTSVMLRTEYGGMNDALYELYLRSGGNPHFKRAAEAWDEVSLFRQLAAGTDVLAGRHANTTIPKLIGALKRYTVFSQNPDLYEQLSEQERADLPMYLTAAQNFWQIVVDDHTYATGANSQSEHFHGAETLYQYATQMGGVGNPQTAETCNEYNMLKLSRELFKLTQDVRYAHYYENTFTNTIVSSQNPDTGMVTYFQAMAPGYNKLYSMPFTDFWCCLGTGMENFSKLGDSLYYKGSDGVWVTMFWSSTFEHADANMRVVQEANLPNDDTVRFTVEAIEGDALGENSTLRLMVPDWIVGEPQLQVNGAEVTPEVKRGFVVLDDLADGDVVEYTMPMEVRVVETPDNPDFFALKYGPTLLSAGLGTSNLDRYSPVGIGVRVPVLDEQAQQIVLVDDTSVAAWKDDVTEHVVRVDDTPDGQVQFALRDTIDGGDLRFTPHYRRHGERYGLYFSYEIKDSAASQQRILTAKRALRDSELTIDSLMTFDNNNSEAAKNLQQEDSEVGTFNGNTFRHSNGGWFSYDLDVDPDAAENVLGVRLYSGDSARTWDVYIDGQKLKTERPDTGAGENVFYWQNDVIPPAHTADGTVTVRFQSTGGWVGGVFGVRTARPQVYDTDARLAGLSADVGTLTPAFSPDTDAYTLTVPAGTSRVALDADPRTPSGLVYFGDVLVDDTRPRTVDLAEDGPTTVTIRSTAQDHETSRTTTVTIEEGAALAAPEATTRPRVTGLARVGRVLRSSTGAWDVPGVRTTRQWLVDGRAVRGETGATYRVLPRDAGKRISVRVRATAPDRPTGEAVSAATAQVQRASTVTRVTAPRTVKAGRIAVVTVRVSAAGVTPQGQVQVRDRGRVVRTVTLRDGRVVVRLPMRGTGRHVIAVSYRGSPWATRSSDATTVRVVR